MADVTSIYGNPIKDAVARADIATNTQDISDLKDGLQSVETAVNAAFVTDTASGSIASFSDGADGVPVKSLTVDIEPVQSGSGDPSPTNIRPISGHTSAVVTRTGKNLAEVTFVGAYNTTTGAKAPASTSTYASTDKFKVNPSTAYVCSAGFTITQLLVWYWDASGTYLRFIAVNSGTTFTTPSDAQYCAVSFRKGSDGSSVSDFPNTQVEIGSTATAYESPNIQTVTISLNGTRYGGTLDVTTGVLTVDRVAYTFTDGTGLVEGTDGNADWLCVRYNWSGVLWDTNKRTQNICSYAPFTFANVNGNPHFYTTANVFQLFVPKGVYPSLSAFTSSLSTKPLTFTAFLSTPQTVQLTANEVKTLLGQNNIWADCGDTEVEYRADTKLYINKMLNA